jgi:hypothetical protein
MCVTTPRGDDEIVKCRNDWGRGLSWTKWQIVPRHFRRFFWTQQALSTHRGRAYLNTKAHHKTNCEDD